MEHALGPTYARHWAGSVVLADLDDRTADQALTDGVPPKRVWGAVWRALELPPAQR